MASVAIDGPSGAGKSSIAREAAHRLNLTYIDTGAMYRAVGLAALRRGLSLDDGEALGRLVGEIGLKTEHIGGEQHVFLGEEDVSEEIRTPEVSIAASRVSAHSSVRGALVALQREMARCTDVIMDGRDICEYVLPNAEVKIYLTASVEARAERRLRQLEEKGSAPTLAEVKKDMERRDYADMHRKNSPLRQAPDAKLIDTSDMDFEQSVEAVISYIKEKTDNASL